MPSIAPQVMAWRLAHKYLPAPAGGGSSPNWLPDGRLNVRVELLIGGGWVDITDRVRVAEVADGISITRGRSDWQARITPATARFTINNADGLFSNRNPNSVYYGQLGRNTQCRIWVGSNLRFTGEISEFPQYWNKPGTDVWVPVEAAGITRRLGKGAKPLRSAVHRITSTAPHIQAYWPLEDGADATQIAGGISGVDPASVTGDVSFAAQSTLSGSAPLPTLGTGGSISGVIPSFADTGRWAVSFYMYLTADITTDTTLFEIQATGGIKYWRLIGSNGSPDSAYLRAYNNVGTEIPPDLSVVPVSIPFNQWVFVRIKVTDNTTFQSWQFSFVTANGVGVGHSNSVTATGGIPYRWNTTATSSTDQSSWGHVAIFDDTGISYLSDAYKAMTGWAGESAAGRIARLCAENNIPCRIEGTDSSLMGPQGIDTLLNLLQSCADTDHGILYEPRDMMAIGYRTRQSLYNQAGITLDYTDGQLSELPLPVEDDQLSLNRVTASKPSGSSATYELTSGRLSTQDPPSGIGVYDEQITVNAYTDASLTDHASFLVSLGTVDEARYPTVSVNLVTDPFRQDDALSNAAMALDSGIYVSIENLPAWLPPDLVELLVQGTTEEMTVVEWRFSFNTTPYAPYRVAVVGDPVYGRLSDNGTFTLIDDVSSSATNWNVTQPNQSAVGLYGLWSTTDEPYTVSCGGETVLVTVSTSPDFPDYNFQVTRSTNGIVKAHTAGTVVTIFRPIYLAL